MSCGSVVLTRNVCVSMTSVLSTGTWWAPQWVYNLRQWLSFLQNSSVATISAGSDRAPQAHHWSVVDSWQTRSYAGLLRATVASWLNWLCHALKIAYCSIYTYLPALILSASSSTIFFNLRECGVSVLELRIQSSVSISTNHESLHSSLFSAKRTFSD